MAGLHKRFRLGRSLWSLAIIFLAALLSGNFILSRIGIAAQLGTRTILIGSSQPSVVTTHSFMFNTTTAGNIGSIQFQYCTNNPFAGTPCTAPAGLSVASATINSQSGASGFSIDPATTTNNLIISRPIGFVNPGSLSYVFGNITNPSIVNHSIYVRIVTYAAAGASGPSTDNGAVVFDLSTGIGVGVFVPPWLVLCVGATVSLDCSSQAHNIQNLGILTASRTGYTTTQFSVGTNDPGGYNVFVNGTTLTSGNNTITANASQQASIRGLGQFGLNLVSNGSPPVGANPTGGGTGSVANGYNVPDLFKFESGDLVASSAISTDYNLYTVSYITNVDTKQAPGIYSTTMTYVGTAAF